MAKRTLDDISTTLGGMDIQDRKKKVSFGPPPVPFAYALVGGQPHGFTVGTFTEQVKGEMRNEATPLFIKRLFRTITTTTTVITTLVDIDTESDTCDLLSLTLDDLVEYRMRGCLCVAESMEMAAAGRVCINIIGEFMAYTMKLPITPKSGSPAGVWPHATALYDDHLALTFHPYILRYFTLSLKNYCNYGQLTGTKILNTMIEGCTTRLKGVHQSSSVCEEDVLSLSSNTRGMYVLCLDHKKKDNGAPEILANFGVYRHLIARYLRTPASLLQVHKGRITGNITDVHLGDINLFIKVYTTLQALASDKRQQLVTEFAPKSELVDTAARIMAEHQIKVPDDILSIHWFTPAIKNNCWFYWDTATPIRWTANNCDTPFLGVNVSLYSLPNGRMHFSSEKCRLAEFKNVRVNKRRTGSWPDDGNEAEWVKSFNGILTHHVAHNNLYNKPKLGYVRARLLGVDIVKNEHCRW